MIYNKWISTKCNKCFYNIDKSIGKRSIVSFDFDDTLVYSDIYKSNNSGKIMPNVKCKLCELYLQYDIVIFSNQNGINKGKITHIELQSKFDKFMDEIEIPLSIFYSIDNDKYRKPNIGMYELCLTLSDNICIEYYCGDAAGRINKSRNDFSASDLYFANNSNIIFKTPEEVFLNCEEITLANRQVKALELYKSDIWKHGKLINNRSLFEYDHIDDIEIPDFDISNKVLIIIVGPQSSGKSTLSKEISELYNFNIINNDTLQNKRLVEEHFKEIEFNCNGIIVDNTNYKYSIREHWISLCNNWNKYIIHIDIPKLQSIYLSKYREFYSNIHIPTVAIHTYYKRFEEINNENVITHKYIKPIVSNNINFNLRFY